MIKEVIIVEGKSDIARVKLAVDADMIATGGLGLSRDTIHEIECAYHTRGIIIFTDPDGPGNRIRKKLTHLFPHALHAFIPKSEASSISGVGIEEASPHAIKQALENVQTTQFNPSKEFNMSDLLKAKMVGDVSAAKRREKASALLHIGYGNAKTFLKKLNHFSISREEWDKVIAAMEEIHV